MGKYYVGPVGAFGQFGLGLVLMLVLASKADGMHCGVMLVNLGGRRGCSSTCTLTANSADYTGPMHGQMGSLASFWFIYIFHVLLFIHCTGWPKTLATSKLSINSIENLLMWLEF